LDVSGGITIEGGNKAVTVNTTGEVVVGPLASKVLMGGATGMNPLEGVHVGPVGAPTQSTKVFAAQV
jgi:hypothetical protein